jgi:hypothetical protein
MGRTYRLGWEVLVEGAGDFVLIAQVRFVGGLSLGIDLRLAVG